jgi:hypothetical protein
MASQTNFYIAGWVSVLGALVNLPLAAVVMAVQFFPENPVLQGVNDVLTIVATAVEIYVLMALKRLLHAHDFQAVDFVLALLVGGLAIGTALDVGGERVLDTPIAGALLLMVAVVTGLIYAVLGYRLLPASRLLAGPLKPFAYLTIIGGLCVATLVLVPLAVPASIAASLTLAIVFFRAAERSAAAPVVPS